MEAEQIAIIDEPAEKMKRQEEYEQKSMNMQEKIKGEKLESLEKEVETKREKEKLESSLETKLEEMKLKAMESLSMLASLRKELEMKREEGELQSPWSEELKMKLEAMENQLKSLRKELEMKREEGEMQSPWLEELKMKLKEMEHQLKYLNLVYIFCVFRVCYFVRCDRLWLGTKDISIFYCTVFNDLPESLKAEKNFNLSSNRQKSVLNIILKIIVIIPAISLSHIN
jgi:hypothetical protein